MPELDSPVVAANAAGVDRPTLEPRSADEQPGRAPGMAGRLVPTRAQHGFFLETELVEAAGIEPASASPTFQDLHA